MESEWRCNGCYEPENGANPDPKVLLSTTYNEQTRGVLA